MAADHRAVVEQGLALKQVGDRLIPPWAAARCTRSASGSAASRGCRARASWTASGTARRGVEQSLGHRAAGRRAGTAGTRAPAAAGRAAARRYPYNDGRIVSSDGLDLASGPGATRSRSTSRGLQRALRPGRRGSTCWAPRRGSRSPATSFIRSPRRRSGQGLRDAIRRNSSLDRRACGGAGARVRGGARHHRRLPPAGGRVSRHAAARASPAGRRKRRAACSSIATTSTTRAT